MSQPLAYFITAHSYGSWIHGSPKGSVDFETRTFGEPLLEPSRAMRQHRLTQMISPPVTLSEEMRMVVHKTVLEVCAHRNWIVQALHVRTTHIHLVVVATAKPEKVLIDCKAYATRRLREAKFFEAKQPVWSEHGSTRYLWDEESVRQAVDYTISHQGAQLLPLPYVGTT